MMPYSFTQPPVGVRSYRSKYRDPFKNTNEFESSNRTFNLMNDPRIFRGNTYASQVLRRKAEEEKKNEEEERERRRSEEKFRMMRKRVKEPKRKDFKEIRDPDEVEPLPGRSNFSVQTHTFQERITDKKIEHEFSTQTDPFSERPTTPEFIKPPEGTEVSVQVGDDLFDFNFEVKPVLEVLVGKCLEQSLLEVMQEEEIQNLKKQQNEFEQRRNIELAETQRLEAEERRKIEEIERRIEQEQERKKKEKIAKKKLTSKRFSKMFLKNLQVKVLSSLESNGYFYDEVKRNVEKDFIPNFLMNSVKIKLRTVRKAKDIIDGLIMKI